MTTDLILLGEMCRHCNNWFIVPNMPRDFQAEHDAAFLSEPDKFVPAGVPIAFVNLCDQIQEFKNDDTNNKTAIASETWENTGYTKDLAATSWQTAFEKDLSLYKRAKFI